MNKEKITILRWYDIVILTLILIGHGILRDEKGLIELGVVDGHDLDHLGIGCGDDFTQGIGLSIFSSEPYEDVQVIDRASRSLFFVDHLHFHGSKVVLEISLQCLPGGPRNLCNVVLVVLQDIDKRFHLASKELAAAIF